MAFLAFSTTNDASFTPISVSVPIYSISLTALSGGDSSIIYSCSSDCHVDVLDSDALTGLTQSLAVAINQYRYVHINACEDGDASFSAQFSGYVDIDSTSYYTHSTNVLAIRNASEIAESISVVFKQCDYYYEFQNDLDISDSINDYLTMYMDNSNLAWGMTTVRDFSDGCIEYFDGSTVTACMHFPQFALLNGSTAPTVEEYRLHITGNAASTVGASVFLMIDSSDAIIGGFTRRYYSETSIDPESLDFDSAIQRVSTNSDDTYSFLTFGDSTDDYKLSFSAFERANHSATYTDSTGTSYNYTAIKQKLVNLFDNE